MNYNVLDGPPAQRIASFTTEAYEGYRPLPLYVEVVRRGNGLPALVLLSFSQVTMHAPMSEATVRLVAQAMLAAADALAREVRTKEGEAKTTENLLAEILAELRKGRAP